jgi:hypothetical protein
LEENKYPNFYIIIILRRKFERKIEDVPGEDHFGFRK